MKIGAKWDEKYLNEVGHFSHVGLGSKVSHSDGTSHLNEMSHLIKTSYQKEKVINLTMQNSNGK